MRSLATYRWRWFVAIAVMVMRLYAPKPEAVKNDAGSA